MSAKHSVEDLETALAGLVARAASISEKEIDRSKRFDHYGLDSADAVMMVGDLEDLVGRPLSATLPYNYPTIAALARRLADGASE